MSLWGAGCDGDGGNDDINPEDFARLIFNNVSIMVILRSNFLRRRLCVYVYLHFILIFFFLAGRERLCILLYVV